MSDELLPYFERELRFFRSTSAGFAARYAKVAGRLGLQGDRPDDPHVERLIEAFAYLNARVRHKLDDDFPEITESFLGILYPHYLAPTPSVAIVEFALDSGQAQKLDGQLIQRHETVETEPIDGLPIRFRTCFPVQLWPIKLSSATLARRPFRAPAVRLNPEPRAVFSIVLETLAPAVSFSQLPIRKLRFFLKDDAPFNFRMFELLMTGTLGIAVAGSHADADCTVLPPAALQGAGFADDEGLFDDQPRSFVGYRLLNEYFAFPEKFLFFDVELPAHALHRLKNVLQLHFYLKQDRPDLEQSVSAQSIRIGCTPIVNLYRQPAEPIRLTQARSEYRVVPDSRRPMSHEVYRVERVVGTSSAGRSVEFQPFYEIKHARPADRNAAYWHVSRQPAAVSNRDNDQGTEVHLSLVDLDFRPSAVPDWTLKVDTTCVSRDLPARLKASGLPKLNALSSASLASVRCLTLPTSTRRPDLGQGQRWRLISHLALNYLSLVEGPDGADALRELIGLYDVKNDPGSRMSIDGLLGVHAERVVGRVVDRVDRRDSTFICRGLEVTLELDEDKFTDGSALVFAGVLERFLGLYCSINSFVKTIVKTKQREGTFFEWPRRAGNQALL
jgi:type VI secretion system protein ImpG